MITATDNRDMFAVALLLLLLVVCVLAAFWGVDSRIDERARRLN
jgi:hypothetical protein